MCLREDRREEEEAEGGGSARAWLPASRLPPVPYLGPRRAASSAAPPASQLGPAPGTGTWRGLEGTRKQKCSW